MPMNFTRRAALLPAPLAAMLIQGRQPLPRKPGRSALGGIICGNPLWLASALECIQDAVWRISNPAAEQMPTSAQHFIINPLTGRGMHNFFITHPSTENRALELRKLAAELGITDAIYEPAAGGVARLPAHSIRPSGTWG